MDVSYSDFEEDTKPTVERKTKSVKEYYFSTKELLNMFVEKEATTVKWGEEIIKENEETGLMEVVFVFDNHR